MKVKKILYIAVIVILLGIFAFSAWYVIDYFAEAAKQKAQYDKLASIVESIQSGTQGESLPTGESTEATQETQEGGILPEYQPLYDQNSDLVGWMQIEGTRVNYPVVQTPETVDYYLYRNFEKEYSTRGCLYVRESCDVNLPSDNVTIYGHNMKDGSMFHDLLNYDRKEYFDEHGIIEFDTLTEHHTYQIFAVFKTTASVGEGFDYHLFENAKNEQEFDSFVSVCKNLSFYDTGFTPAYGDKLICLSTCEYTLTNGRFVVVAYRIS